MSADGPTTGGPAGIDWETVIGLEVHCELLTETKLFCGCRNAFGDQPNTNVCPVCLGLPGSLPVLNERAVELAMRIGTALHCDIVPSSFARKNYFYPDMPKDYQISQYDEPINVGGWLELPEGARVGVTRAHLEEDTGKTTHLGEGGRMHSAEHSLVDYNRSGVPLVETVSEPDMRGAAEARSYAAELRAILVATGASDGRMEEGSMRVDANVSVRPRGSAQFGTRCEIKNLNSLRSLSRAIEYEASRQIALIEAGEAQLDQVHAVVDQGLDLLVVAATEAGVSPPLALVRAANEVAADVEAGRDLEPGAFAALLTMEEAGQLSATQSKTVLAELLAAGGGDPVAIAAAKGFEALDAGSLAGVVGEVIAANPAEWGRYVSGTDEDRKKLGGFFTGQVMKATRGKADGKAVAAELARRRG